MAIISSKGEKRVFEILEQLAKAAETLLPDEHTLLKAGLLKLKNIDVVSNPMHSGSIIRMLFTKDLARNGYAERDGAAVSVSIRVGDLETMRSVVEASSYQEALYGKMHTGVDKAYKKFMEIEDFSKRVTPETEEQSAKDDALVDQFLSDPDSFPKPKPQWQSPYVASFEVAK